MGPVTDPPPTEKDFKEGNETMYRRHIEEKQLCAILYDYIVDLTK